jgi:NhaP-type Na+/H+ or K+/H+ antiporter
MAALAVWAALLAVPTGHPPEPASLLAHTSHRRNATAVPSKARTWPLPPKKSAVHAMAEANKTHASRAGAAGHSELSDQLKPRPQGTNLHAQKQKPYPWPFGALGEWKEYHLVNGANGPPTPAVRNPPAATGSGFRALSGIEKRVDQDDPDDEHPVYAAMLFPIIAVSIGVAIELLISRVAVVSWLPYTPTLMVLGMCMGFLSAYEPINVKHIHESIRLWERFDGHLLVFVFIPPLVFGEAMALDWHMLKRCIGQCLLLAGPGVMVGTVMMAFFIMYGLPYHFSWSLALAFGAVLSATDPVAVMALLNSLGASPALSMMIGGESLLNDGSAMVLFHIFFASSFAGDDESYLGMTLMLVVGSCVIGVMFGGILMFCLWLTADRLIRIHAVLQVVITLVGSYGCFYFAEGLAGASGILALVTMGSVLSFSFWPLIADPVELRVVWHMVEWLLNTLLFQLVGLIIGFKFMRSNITYVDFLYAVLTWFVLLVVRFIIVFSFYPALRRMGYGTTWQALIAVSWGGLRGALGLALGLMMESHLIATGETVLGHAIVLDVAVVAMLSLVINAPTTAPLLRALGLIKTQREKQFALAEVYKRLQDYAYRQFLEIGLPSHLGHEPLLPIDEEWREWVRERVTALRHELNVWTHVGAWVPDARAKGGGPGLEQAAFTTEDVAEVTTDIQQQVRGMMDSFRRSREEAAELKPPPDAALNEVQAMREAKQLVADAQLARRKAAAQRASPAKGRGPLAPLPDDASLRIKRLTELRVVYLRVVKRNYATMVYKGQLAGYENVALELNNSVNVAADYAWTAQGTSHAFRDWDVLLHGLEPSWRQRAFADGQMDWLVRGSYRLLRWLRVKDAAVKVAGVDLMLHTLYLLTCYVSAHEAAQHEVEEVYGAEGTYFADEAAVVKRESSDAIDHAKRYLDRLRRIDVPLSAPGNPPAFATMDMGQPAPQVPKGLPVPLPASGRLADGVRAKQAAHLILFWLESYVHELHHEGCLDEADEARLLDEVHRDRQALQRARIMPSFRQHELAAIIQQQARHNPPPRLS